MADPNDPNLHQLPEDDGTPIEEEPMEVEAPRRAASAEFIVDTEVGAEAALREAMDPANQSLAEALRLSYRVLQVVIAALVLLFLFSGFQTVESGQTGVMLRWGRILEKGDGREALEPGLHFSAWPYPAGQFIIFGESGEANLENAFFPQVGTAVNALEAAAGQANVNNGVSPGSVGALLTRDGDLAHMKIAASYDILDAGDYVRTLPPASVNAIVETAVRRAAIHVASTLALQDIIDLSDENRRAIRDRAQNLLDELDCGVLLADVNVTQTAPPLAVLKVWNNLQQARQESQATISEAQDQASRDLIAVAGESYDELIALIDEYEAALERDDAAASDAVFDRINLALDEAKGEEVNTIIGRAKSYESDIELTLGAEAKRFASLLPSYRENPDVFVRTRWLETYGRVMNRPDTERFIVPDGIREISLATVGIRDVQEARRDMRLNQRDAEAMGNARFRPGDLIPTYDQLRDGGPGRRLSREQVEAQNERNNN